MTLADALSSAAFYHHSNASTATDDGCSLMPGDWTLTCSPPMLGAGWHSSGAARSTASDVAFRPEKDPSDDIYDAWKATVGRGVAPCSRKERSR
eukprot:gene10439-7422_t